MESSPHPKRKQFHRLQKLSVDDVKRIYLALVDAFAKSTTPIYPSGVKSESLLESAVFRQSTSFGDIAKYPDAYSNAASLAFGLCCDHPFHNGNKRTALISLLVHLYNNGLMLDGVGDDDLYNLLISISTHSICRDAPISSHYSDRPSPDAEVDAIAAWIQGHSRPMKHGAESESFYAEADPKDALILRYRAILERLANS